MYLRTLRNTPFGPKKKWIPLVCEAAAFWDVGGYDDAIRGWGPEDQELIDRLDRSGIKEGPGTAALVETLRHSNEARSTYYEHTIDVSAVISFHYVEIKRRYFETRSQWFTDAQRHSTYRAVEQAVLASLGEPEGDAIFDIRIAESAPPWSARRGREPYATSTRRVYAYYGTCSRPRGAHRAAPRLPNDCHLTGLVLPHSASRADESRCSSLMPRPRR